MAFVIQPSFNQMRGEGEGEYSPGESILSRTNMTAVTLGVV